MQPLKEMTFAMDAIFAYLHFLAMLGLAGCLMGEYLLLGTREPRNVVELVGRLDTVQFAMLGLAALTGLARVMTSMRGMIALADNPVFWLKILVFMVLAGLSFLPSRRYAGWRHHIHMDAGWQIPAAELSGARRVALAEMGLLAILPLLAVLMARGMGLAY